MMPPMFPAHHHPARTRRQGDVNWRVSSKMISATVPFGESFGSRRTAVLRCLVPHSFSVQQHLGKRALPFVCPLGLLRRRLPYLGVVVARARTSVLSPSNPKSQKRIHTHTHTHVSHLLVRVLSAFALSCRFLRLLLLLLLQPYGPHRLLAELFFLFLFSSSSPFPPSFAAFPRGAWCTGSLSSSSLRRHLSRPRPRFASWFVSLSFRVEPCFLLFLLFLSSPSSFRPLFSVFCRLA